MKMYEISYYSSQSFSKLLSLRTKIATQIKIDNTLERTQKFGKKK
jgi:hypothetical protein